MKNLQFLLRLSVIAFVITSISLHKTKAQSDAGEFIRGGINDAETLMQAYLEPFGKSFGANMNSGWVNTAQPLKLGRFEFKVVANVGLASKSERYYNLADLPISADWEYDKTENPTVLGPSDKSEAGMIWQNVTNPSTGQTEKIPNINLPPGSGIGFNPIPPAAQLSIGLFKGTEIMGRYIPQRDVFGVNIGMWGLGLKHDIKQWIPVIKNLPFDLSIAFAYSDLTAKYDIGIDPKSPDGSSEIEFADPNASGTGYNGPAYNSQDYDSQALNFNGTAWNANVLISKKLSVLSVYGGIRYASSTTNIAMRGTYGYPTEPYYNQSNLNDPNNGKYQLEKIPEEDNPELNMPLNQIGLTGGFRLKLAVLTIFAEATLSDYSTVSAGVGLGWIN